MSIDTMRPHIDMNANRETGFTLVEMLVSIAIGLIGIVVMFQVMSVGESLKRTTSAGSDSQIAGTVAMFSLESDVRPAGLGFGRVVDPANAVLSSDAGTVPSHGCTVSAKGSTASFLLVPVLITQGAAAGDPDTITTLYGNSSLFVSTQKFKGSTNSTKTVDGSYGGFRVGDVVVAGGSGSGTACEMFQVSSDATAGMLGHATVSTFNPAPSQIAFTSGYLYNLGPNPQRNVWSIQNGRLMMRDSLRSANAVEVGDNIIDLQAEYGVDANGNGLLEDGEWTTTTPANWSQLLAVRVALLSRSQQFEKIPVTGVAPRWSGADFAMSDIAGAAGDVAKWQHYRYRVYEKVIPLRNMVWGGA